jgi:hypothetical protein
MRVGGHAISIFLRGALRRGIDRGAHQRLNQPRWLHL